MLSVETQTKIRDFLKAIGDYELSIEGLRQNLASILQFEPYSSFLRIDRQNQRCITSESIRGFLNENNRNNYSVRDCDYLIKYFDIDCDGVLNYTEFMQMVLPCDNLLLRSEASQR